MAHRPRGVVDVPLQINLLQTNLLTLSMRAMMLIETVRMAMVVMNQEGLRTLSPTPIVLMYSFSLTCHTQNTDTVSKR